MNIPEHYFPGHNRETERAYKTEMHVKHRWMCPECRIKAWASGAAAKGPPEIKSKVIWKYHGGPHNTRSPGAYKILIRLWMREIPLGSM